MRTFTIDFFELGFLAEACIPPRPIARTMFWQNLTDVYWFQMTEEERSHLFQWIQKGYSYEESLKSEEETQIFHARFDPNNQYIVKTIFKGEEKVDRTFKFKGRYYIKRNTFIAEECITNVEKKLLLG